MISHPMDDPYSPAKADIRNFLKKSAAARRALSELGPNDPKANMRMAESLITISAEQFMKKWNFDPIRFRPMAPGRYVWTPVKTKKVRPQATTTALLTSLPSCSATPFESLASETTTSALEERLSGHHLSNAAIDFSATTTKTHTTTMLETAQPTTTTLVSPVLGTPKKSSSPSPSGRAATTPKTKQCKITAYGRQRKRLHSTSKTEEGVEIEVITPRKRLALSPSKL